MNHLGADVLICPVARSSTGSCVPRKIAELRSAGQMRTSAPTWLVALALESFASFAVKDLDRKVREGPRKARKANHRANQVSAVQDDELNLGPSTDRGSSPPWWPS